MAIEIVTTSSSDISQELAKELGITVLPHEIAFGDKSYADGVDILPDEFYERLKQSPKIPTTSAVTTGPFAQAYNKLAEKTNEILCIVLSSGLSVTHDAAIKAKEAVEKKNVRVEVIETLGVAGGVGLIVLEALKSVKAGETMDKIVEMVKLNVPRCHVRICVDTLKYLQKGGRIGRVQALMGSILNVKPILEARGQFHPIGRVRSHAKVLDHLYEYIGSFKKINAMALQYTDNKPSVKALAERVSKFFPLDQIHIWPLTPVCGTHAGPGSIVASVIGDR
jgi:DegV family protein with EDD domain